MILKNVLGYRKVKTIRVYVWIGLTIILSFKNILKVKQVFGVYSPQSHDWPRVYFVLFYPKLLGAQICMGSQVVRILQAHLVEFEAGGFIS